jgi:serine/threonine protein kinase
MIGSTLGPYHILAKLGEGGMGTAYRARDTVLDRTVAIKVLEVTDANARSHLLHEARAASALNHPNIVTIHGVEQHGDTAFIVMEHVDGVPLDRAIPGDGLPLAQALRFAADIADALAAAHAHGIVHRDIKPGNVMITTAGRVEVLDFGIARRTASPDQATRAVTLGSGFTALGMVVGTAGYMAPEQISGHPGGPPSDVFALGAALFHMLTVKGPFAGASTWAVMDATVHDEPPSVAMLKPEPRRGWRRWSPERLPRTPTRASPTAARCTMRWGRRWRCSRAATSHRSRRRCSKRSSTGSITHYLGPVGQRRVRPPVSRRTLTTVTGEPMIPAAAAAIHAERATGARAGDIRRGRVRPSTSVTTCDRLHQNFALDRFPDATREQSASRSGRHLLVAWRPPHA